MGIQFILCTLQFRDEWAISIRNHITFENWYLLHLLEMIVSYKIFHAKADIEYGVKAFWTHMGLRVPLSALATDA